MAKQVLITGASSDIGIALCRRYIDAGDVVIAHYRRSETSCFERLRIEAGNRLITLQCDFSNSDTLEQMIHDNQELLDKTDVLITMAALREPITFAEVKPEDLLRHFTVNVIPTVMLTQRLGPRMAKRGWGRIVNISSIGVKFGGGQSTFCYSLTKHASEFMPAVYREWAAHNVMMNTVRVGVTDTRYFKEMNPKTKNERIALIPARRMAMPEEMAEYIYWLGSENNTFMTGQVIMPSGGE